MELSQVFTGPLRWEAFDEALKAKPEEYEIRGIACSTTPEGEQILQVEFGSKQVTQKQTERCPKCGQKVSGPPQARST